MKVPLFESNPTSGETNSIAPGPATALAEFGDRLVTLCDGRTGLRGGLSAVVSAPNIHAAAAGGELAPGRESEPILDFVASTESMDRYKEIILAEGWRLDHYRRNPVFQNAHQYGDILFTLGKALITEVRGGGPGQGSPYLFQRIQFATAINPMARIAYGLYKEKFLNAVSVGFIPIRWEDGAGGHRSVGAPSSSTGGHRSVGAPTSSTQWGSDGALPSTAGRSSAPVRRSPQDEGGSPQSVAPWRRYLEQELLEVSAVGIPANPEALQLGLRAGAIPRADLRDLVDWLCDAGPVNAASGLNHFRSDSAVPNTHACASGVRGNEARLLQLARALREILRRT